MVFCKCCRVKKKIFLQTLKWVRFPEWVRKQHLSYCIMGLNLSEIFMQALLMSLKNFWANGGLIFGIVSREIIVQLFQVITNQNQFLLKILLKKILWM